MIWQQIHAATEAAAPGSTKDDLIKGIAAGALGLIGTLATVVVSWLKDRDISATRLRELDEASKRVAFWDAWFKALTLFEHQPKSLDWQELAKAEILSASVAIKKLFAIASVDQLTESERWRLRRQKMSSLRRGLLLYSPPRLRAWIPRTIFYIYLLAPAIFIIQYAQVSEAFRSYVPDLTTRIASLSAIPNPTAEETAIRKELQMRYDHLIYEKADRAAHTLQYVIASIVLALAFRAWSIYLERPRSNSQAPVEQHQ